MKHQNNDNPYIRRILDKYLAGPWFDDAFRLEVLGWFDPAHPRMPISADTRAALEEILLVAGELLLEVDEEQWELGG